MLDYLNLVLPCRPVKFTKRVLSWRDLVRTLHSVNDILRKYSSEITNSVELPSYKAMMIFNNKRY